MTRVFLRTLTRHPGLALEAVRLLAATAPPGWFRRPPFLPVTDPEFLEWRMLTAYGRAGITPSRKEVEEFLLWRGRLRRSRRRL